MSQDEWDDFIFKWVWRCLKLIGIGFAMMFFAAFTWIILTDGNVRVPNKQ
jgi:hypothetical protein